MKKVIFSWLFSMVFFLAANAQYADRTGYEGDNFSLEGAIELFKQSYSIRDFERKLNTQDTWVNNLDLDWDGRIDYVRVEHRRQGNYHAIILSVPLGYYDVQDIAVIEIEKVGRRRAMLQIVGDPDIYGEEVIVEPISQDGYSYNGDYRYDYGGGGYVNVYYWHAVQHMLGRNYRVYASPYYYHYYPTWWSPWRPCAWNVYRPRIVVYHRHYHVVRVHRVIHVHNFYRPYRVYSHNVLVRTNEVRVKHGKAVVHRKPMKQQKNHNRYNEYVKATKSVAKQPRGTGHTNNIENNRKAQERVPATTPRTSAKANKNERSPATRPSTGRVNTDARKPSVDNKRTAPATSDKAKRNTQTPTRSTPKATPKTNRSSSATKSTPRSTPKATPKTNRSSSAKKSTPRSTPKANRSTSQPKRSTSKASSRSTTTKRSTPSAGKSKSSSRSSASKSSSKSSSRPAAKSSGSSRSSSSTKATRKTSSSSSRNKRG